MSRTGGTEFRPFRHHHPGLRPPLLRDLRSARSGRRGTENVNNFHLQFHVLLIYLGPMRHPFWHVAPAVKRSLRRTAKHNRYNPTPTENILWQNLRKRQNGGLRVRRQQPIGPYIVDFYIASAGLIIEVDGAVHHGHEKADLQRQTALEALGYRFLRFTATEVEQRLPWVLGRIIEVAAQSGPPATVWRIEG